MSGDRKHYDKVAFAKEMEGIVNKYGIDHYVDTTDFIITNHIIGSLDNLRNAIELDKKMRDDS